MAKLRVELGEFTAESGAKVSSNACDLRFVRYSYRMSSQQSHGDWTYMIMPWFLVRRESVEVKQPMSVRWWLNVDVPRYAAPGAYRTTAKLYDGLTLVSELLLTLKVAGLKLDPVPSEFEFATQWSSRLECAPTPDSGFYGFATRCIEAPRPSSRTCGDTASRASTIGSRSTSASCRSPCLTT